MKSGEGDDEAGRLWIGRNLGSTGALGRGRGYEAKTGVRERSDRAKQVGECGHLLKRWRSLRDEHNFVRNQFCFIKLIDLG